jgi:hypothetical protein
VPNAPCFDEPLDPDQILNIRLINDAQLLELQTIYDYVVKHGIEGQWVRNLRLRMDAYININQEQKQPATVLWQMFRKLSSRL